MSGPLREATLFDVMRALEARYPPETAADWDAVGLICGDGATVVRRVLWAVDPTEAALEQALEVSADLIVTHHPLFLTGVHSVAATTPKGRLVHRCIEAGIALYNAHTNADVANPGVSDALAVALNVRGLRPLVPGATPITGLGRIGTLPEPSTLREYARYVTDCLPVTGHGVRIQGHPAQPVRTVAVCGGSGDSLLPVATAAGADVLVTADLKHHRTLDHREAGGCAVIDIAHWASEWPWIVLGAQLLEKDMALMGMAIKCEVSRIDTDPWNWHESGKK